MAAAIIDVYRALDQWAPFDTQMDFDNAGFLVGRGEREVRRVLVSLDITEAVAAEAGRWGAELIVSHHPVIFHPVKALTDQTSTGRTLLLLAEQGIGAVCAHTNLDAAQGGVNDCLARALELDGVELLCRDGTDGQGRPYGIGRVGTAPQAGCSAAEFATFIKEKLSACSIRFVETGRPVRRVAVGGGACVSMLSDALAAGCDTFVTADVKYDQYLEAKALGINLMDAGHFATEDVVCPALVQFLSRHFPKVEVRRTESHREAYDSV